MAHKRKPIIVISDDVWQSEPFSKLSGTAIRVLLWLYSKRQLVKIDHSRRKESYHIKNNGSITFTYAEAEKHGIGRDSFMRAIDKLVAVGFVDVYRTGAGVFRLATLYGLSDRWKLYGTDRFVEKKRNEFGTAHTGFRKGHAPTGSVGTDGTL